MAEELRIATSHADLAGLLDELADRVDPKTVRLRSDAEVTPGGWVRFTHLLRDGSSAWEGLGRCKRCRARAGADGPYELVLEGLTFDARNEVVYERALLFSAHGPRTGHHGLADNPGPIAPSEPPPSKYAAPKVPVDVGPPLGKNKLSNPLRDALRPKPSHVIEAVRSEGLPIHPELLERAEDLARKLKLAAPALTRGRWTDQRVLEAALRMGLDALERLTVLRDE